MTNKNQEARLTDEQRYEVRSKKICDIPDEYLPKASREIIQSVLTTDTIGTLADALENGTLAKQYEAHRGASHPPTAQMISYTQSAVERMIADVVHKK